VHKPIFRPAAAGFAICCALTGVGAWRLAASVQTPPPANPAVIFEQTLAAGLATPPRVRAVLNRACRDCHSNETSWPWYSRVPPIAALIRADVAEGRRTFNVSEWSTQFASHPGRASGILKSACEAAKSGLMPPAPYRLFHAEARLSAQDTVALCAWASSASRELLARVNQPRMNVNESE
jgi:hypothetical protein